MSDLDLRICNTEDLKALVADAQRRRFNRVPVLPENVDPDGNHVLSRILFGHNMDRPGVPLHHRCLVLVKVADSMQPFEVVLDVEDGAFNALHQPEAVLSESA